ncbi:MAG TPA: hypothetical protein VFS93_03270 [Terrimesophilobacter sp.]|nr:hypothetical protein [Terrimesophilobacter sp.]
MTMTAPITLLEAPEMSVVARKFVVGEEMNTMTTATALDCATPLNRTVPPNGTVRAPVARRAPARGIDRALTTLAVAMLKWSRAREQRAATSHQEHYRRLQLRNSELQREADALRLTQRIGL